MRVSPWLTVLSYHRAAKMPLGCEYDEGVVDVTPEHFEEHLAVLERHCNVITLAQLRAFLRGASLPTNPVLLTFDDGYLDNHDVVLPLLRRYGMSAVFFIATSYVEQRRLFWWDHVNVVLKESRKERLELVYPYRMTIPLDPARERRGKAIHLVLRTIKDQFALDLDRFLEHVSTAADVDLSQAEQRRRADSLLMTWDHVRALRRAGMDVQSHTSTHRVLQTLSPSALAHELSASREMLEEVLGERVSCVSYPVGTPIGAAPHIREAVRAAGYELGFSNCTGVNHAWHFDPLDTRRMPADTAESATHLESLLAVPYLS